VVDVEEKVNEPCVEQKNRCMQEGAGGSASTAAASPNLSMPFAKNARIRVRACVYLSVVVRTRNAGISWSIVE
jgi:hypothetical protein